MVYDLLAEHLLHLAADVLHLAVVREDRLDQQLLLVIGLGADSLAGEHVSLPQVRYPLSDALNSVPAQVVLIAALQALATKVGRVEVGQAKGC